MRLVTMLFVALVFVGCDEETVGRRPVTVAPTGRIPLRCTTTWVGPQIGGVWSVGKNWSRGRPPNARDIACVPRTFSVAITGGDWNVGALVDGGGLVLLHGSLYLASRSVASEVADFRFFDGRLSGPSPLYITRTLFWGGGTMAGQGAVEIGPGAVGQIGSKRRHAPIYPGRRPPPYGPVDEQTLSRFQQLKPSDPRVPCGEKSPPGLVMCARGDTPDAKAIAALWKRFRGLVAAGRQDITARDRLQDLLTPQACLQRARDQSEAPGVAPNCIDVIDRLIASFDPLRWDKQIGQFLIRGRVAFGGASPLGAMRFAKVGGHWVITSMGAADR